MRQQWYAFVVYFMPSFLDDNTVLEVEPIIISIAVVNSILNIYMFLVTFKSDFWTVIPFFQSDMFVGGYICLEYS
jgi:hypothetical protein